MHSVAVRQAIQQQAVAETSFLDFWDMLVQEGRAAGGVCTAQE